MCLRVLIDYSAMYKELDLLLADKKKLDYSAMIFDSVDELKDFNSRVRREMGSENKTGSRGAPGGSKSIP